MARAENATFSQCVTIAKDQLHMAKRELQVEIANYPTPISGCDAQFNHMLAERRKIQSALDALEAEFHIPTPRAP